MSKIKELEELLLGHCYEMSILKEDAPEKKKDAILDSLIAAIYRSGLDIEDVRGCIRDVNDDRVIDLDFFQKGGDLFSDYINKKWVDFARALFRQRSVGLGTPNAASGEGELMFLFLSKGTQKPISGDLLIGDEVIELKGEQVRVMGDVRGTEFREKTIRVAKHFGLIPNKANRTNLDAVEIEKAQHLDYWKVELAKLPLKRQKEFIGEWLSCMDGNQHSDSVDNIFKGGSFDQESLIREIVKILYSVMINDEYFDKFVVLGDGSNVKIISKDISDFKSKVDKGEIVPECDYFRINQSMNIGWYIA